MRRFNLWILAVPFLLGMGASLPETRIRLLVADQDGVPVANALVCCGFESAGSGGDVFYGCTDKNGEFTSVARRTYCAFYQVAKEGCYGWNEVIRTLDVGGIEKSGILKTLTCERKVVMKRIGVPIPIQSPGSVHLTPHPPLGQWVGYDLQTNDYCPPLGKGEHPDCLMRLRGSVENNAVSRILEISFTNNPHAGFYVMKKDMCSDLKSAARADSNRAFAPTLRYEYHENPKGGKQTALERDEYAVYRTRTKADRDGGLVSAHYGMIYGGSCNLYANKGMRIGGVFFNPSPNDTNLEHSEAARRSRIALGQMLERKAKAETCR